MRESVKPMEKIEGIRILSLDGLNGGGAGGGGRSATDEVIDSALRYRVQAPLIDLILVRYRGRRRQPVQDGRPDPRGARHAGYPQGHGAEGEPKPAERLRKAAARAAAAASARSARVEKA